MQGMDDQLKAAEEKKRKSTVFFLGFILLFI
jgi:hypothetical protein